MENLITGKSDESKENVSSDQMKFGYTTPSIEIIESNNKSQQIINFDKIEMIKTDTHLQTNKLGKKKKSSNSKNKDNTSHRKLNPNRSQLLSGISKDKIVPAKVTNMNVDKRKYLSKFTE